MALKSKLIVGLAMFGVITLGACGTSTITDAQEPEVIKGGFYHTIVTDTETGCQYIESVRGTPLIPRLNSEGKPMCGKDGE